MQSLRIVAGALAVGSVVMGNPSPGMAQEGHRPSPGECRVWDPTRPAGHQPSPVRCSPREAAFYEYGYEIPPRGWRFEEPVRPLTAWYDREDQRRAGEWQREEWQRFEEREREAWQRADERMREDAKRADEREREARKRWEEQQREMWKRIGEREREDARRRAEDRRDRRPGRGG